MVSVYILSYIYNELFVLVRIFFFFIFMYVWLVNILDEDNIGLLKIVKWFVFEWVLRLIIIYYLNMVGEFFDCFNFFLKLKIWFNLDIWI